MRKKISSLIKVFLIIGFIGLSSTVVAAPPTIWGVKYRVTHMSLNATGFVSWLKVVNPSTLALPINANIIWTLADGTEGSVTNVNLGSVDAGGIATISEATILTAMGNPVQLVDVSLEVIIEGSQTIVTAEKKASDGRLPILTERTYLLTSP